MLALSLSESYGLSELWAGPTDLPHDCDGVEAWRGYFNYPGAIMRSLEMHRNETASPESYG